VVLRLTIAIGWLWSWRDLLLGRATDSFVLYHSVVRAFWQLDGFARREDLQTQNLRKKWDKDKTHFSAFRSSAEPPDSIKVLNERRERSTANRDNRHLENVTRSFRAR